MSENHAQSKSLYLGVLLALLFLTIITVAVSRVDFGSLNVIVAMLIASIKALLVLLFFMHLKFESPVVWLYAVIPVLLIFIMLGGVFVDNPFREEYPPFGGESKKVMESPQQEKAHF